jgi:hypothetical protein
MMPTNIGHGLTQPLPLCLVDPAAWILCRPQRLAMHLYARAKKMYIYTRLYTIIYSTLKILKHRTVNKALCCGWAPWQPRRFTAWIRSQRYALWAQSLDRLMRHTWLSLKIKDLEDHRLTCRFLVLIIQLFRYPIWTHIRHLC